MRNAEIKSKRVMKLVDTLPFFSAAHLAPTGEKQTYLNIIFSRQVKRDALVRLRKNLYVTRSYLDQQERKGFVSDYIELAANIIYPPSYISLDYVLYGSNMITEIPRNITSMALRKTGNFSNSLGNFIYHKIKEELFLGFKIVKKGKFSIFKATKAKALFDFLYLRKRLLIDRSAVEELRLNLDEFRKADFKELEQYIKIEGSSRMKEIGNWLR